MKYIAKNGRVYNDRVSATLASVRHLITKNKKTKDEEDLMEFEEFDDDFDGPMDEDSDEPGPECDNNDDGTDDSDNIDNVVTTTDDENTILISTQPRRFRHDAEPLFTAWKLGDVRDVPDETMTTEALVDFRVTAMEKMNSDINRPVGKNGDRVVFDENLPELPKVSAYGIGTLWNIMKPEKGFTRKQVRIGGFTFLRIRNEDDDILLISHTDDLMKSDPYDTEQITEVGFSARYYKIQDTKTDCYMIEPKRAASVDFGKFHSHDPYMMLEGHEDMEWVTGWLTLNDAIRDLIDEASAEADVKDSTEMASTDILDEEIDEEPEQL